MTELQGETVIMLLQGLGTGQEFILEALATIIEKLGPVMAISIGVSCGLVLLAIPFVLGGRKK